MKKWMIILAVIVIIAAAAVAIWRPWKQTEPVTLQEDQQNGQFKFLATIVEQKNGYVLVSPLEGETERNSSDLISFSVVKLKDIDASVGSVVEISYDGLIRETYPASIDVSSWALSDVRAPFPTQWLDKETAEKYDNNIFDNIEITAICSDCFFARTITPTAYTIKLNGVLNSNWCVGDRVIVTYENTYYDEENQRVEVDFLTVKASEMTIDPNKFTAAAKPVIYLYPEQETDVSVTLDLSGQLTCTYPAYDGLWQVTAAPDGTLTDKKGQTYNYLYWEGLADMEYDFSEGFCVKGEDTAAFLEWALAELGLNRREANEFIVYWLPLMEANPYNIIAFQQENYTDAARLEVTPAPDTVIRVFMAWYGTDLYTEIEPQDLSAPDRYGFTLIEWGGTEVIDN